MKKKKKKKIIVRKIFGAFGREEIFLVIAVAYNFKLNRSTSLINDKLSSVNRDFLKGFSPS